MVVLLTKGVGRPSRICTNDLGMKTDRNFFESGHGKGPCDGLGATVKFYICDPSARNQSHVGRVRFPLRAEMHGRGHITDSCFIAFITSKIC